MITIKEADDSELNDVLLVERLAFGSDVEAQLVQDLLNDPSAKPTLSLLALHDNNAVGHILFTHAWLKEKTSLSLSILAPLAVIPVQQKQGIGGRLIEHGSGILQGRGIDLVFVLGYPEYYTRYGFQPAFELGFDAPYPIPKVNADAWMVKILSTGNIEGYNGQIVCSDTLNRPELWRE